ncbi:MAG TPA: S8 family serine peptidase, partial [Phnomibacter sp.]|nr:S8 family serine peptidase [Phnomibacter sp.]
MQLPIYPTVSRKRSPGFIIILLASCFLFAIPLLAQKVILPSGILNFQSLNDEVATSSFQQKARFADRYFFAVSFLTTPRNTQVEELRGAGTTISEKLAPNVYLVESTVAPTREWMARNAIGGLAIVPPGLKLDERIVYNNIPPYALAAKEVVRLMIGIYGNASKEQMLQALAATGFQLTNGQWLNAGILSGNASLKDLEKIAGHVFVYAIRLQQPEEKTLNNIGRASSGATLLSAPVTQGGRGLSGLGVTVGVGDDSDPTLHPDVTDRVINHTPGITNNHGAHITGTVAGAGILNNRVGGFAPQATVVSQYFSGIWKNAGIYTNAYNMVVTNNSYGSIVGDCLYAGVYDLNSRLLDLTSIEYPQLLHVFAAGNDGDNTCAPFPRAYHTVLGGYQSAKNIITAGRTDYTQVSSSSSSSGPVKDGRLKPEITGLGIITSMNGAGTGYYTEFGTSQSAPNITGGLTLLYQRYRQLHGNSNPS